MKDKKNILLHLYGDPEAEGDLRSLLKDPNLQEEHKALSEAKFRMDHLVRSRPDPAVIDRILAEASQGDAVRSVGKRRGDRAPAWRFRPLRRVLVPAVSIAAVLVVSVGLGWFHLASDSTEANRATLADRDQSVLAESLLKATPVNPEMLAPAATQVADPLLAWDDAETIRNMYRRIETIRPSDPLDWGARSIPLETIPGSVRSSVLQAGAQRERR